MQQKCIVRATFGLSENYITEARDKYQGVKKLTQAEIPALNGSPYAIQKLHLVVNF